MDKKKDEKEFDISVNLKKNEEKIDYTKFYVLPHKKKSVPVTPKNLKIVLKDSLNMVMMCQTPHGIYSAAYAIAHSQINDKKPLRFFVTHEGELIINPKIVRHTRHTINSEEGCMSFKNGPMIIVQRWNKCEVEFCTLNEENKLTEIIIRNLSGKESKVWQHSIDYFNSISIYDKN